MIKDSGERREFETGAVRDIVEGKGRMDLLPWAAIMEVSKHCEAGAKKYGEHNVDKGIPIHSLIDSACRHLAKYQDGWDDEPHLLAAAWNLLWAVQMEIKMPQMQDIPSRMKTVENKDCDVDAENNKPLSADELRLMKGEPVYTIDKDYPNYTAWRILKERGKDCFVFTDFDCYDIKTLGTKWVAYRHKPKEYLAE